MGPIARFRSHRLLGRETLSFPAGPAFQPVDGPLFAVFPENKLSSSLHFAFYTIDREEYSTFFPDLQGFF